MSNPKDQEVIAEIERVKAAGLDPFGDDELDNPTMEADEPADEQDIDPENPDETTDETVTDEAPTVPTYTADIPADSRLTRR